MWAVCQCTCPFKPCHNCAAFLRPRNLPCRSFTYTIGGLTGGSGRLFSFRFPGSIPASFADVQPVVTQRAKEVFPLEYVYDPTDEHLRYQDLDPCSWRGQISVCRV